jgi:hypothetical protein
VGSAKVIVNATGALAGSKDYQVSEPVV